jgi:hypothetical protein
VQGVPSPERECVVYLTINEQLSIEQNDEKLIFDALIFLVLLREKHQTTFANDRVQIALSKELSTIQCDDYSMEIAPNNPMFKSLTVEMLFRQNRCEFKSDGQVLVAGTDGTERVVQLVTKLPAKKSRKLLKLFGITDYQ